MGFTAPPEPFSDDALSRLRRSYHMAEERLTRAAAAFDDAESDLRDASADADRWAAALSDMESRKPLPQSNPPNNMQESRE